MHVKVKQPHYVEVTSAYFRFVTVKIQNFHTPKVAYFCPVTENSKFPYTQNINYSKSLKHISETGLK